MCATQYMVWLSVHLCVPRQYSVEIPELIKLVYSTGTTLF